MLIMFFVSLFPKLGYNKVRICSVSVCVFVLSQYMVIPNWLKKPTVAFLTMSVRNHTSSSILNKQ